MIFSIKQKKELAGVADSYVREALDFYLAQHPVAFPLEPKDAKLIIKAVRAQLRRATGMFKRGHSKSTGIAAHQSSRERAASYILLKNIITRLKPASILDLGCGLNPLAVASPSVPYYAYDVNESDIAQVRTYLSNIRNPGFARVADVQKEINFPHADLCLMLKLVDLLDTRGHKNAERLMDKVSCNHLIVSFSTKTLSGKPMRHPQRGWIERLAKRKGYTFSKHVAENELFYVIEKFETVSKMY